MVIDIMYLILHSGLAHECHRVCVGGGGEGSHACTYTCYIHRHCTKATKT